MIASGIHYYYQFDATFIFCTNLSPRSLPFPSFHIYIYIYIYIPFSLLCLLPFLLSDSCCPLYFRLIFSLVSFRSESFFSSPVVIPHPAHAKLTSAYSCVVADLYMVMECNSGGTLRDMFERYHSILRLISTCHADPQFLSLR